jgi:hypothetical protein
VKFIDGYPGKYVILARRSGNRWIVAGINAQKEPLKTTISVPMYSAGSSVKLYSDNPQLVGNVKDVKINKKQQIEITIPCNGGVVITD